MNVDNAEILSLEEIKKRYPEQTEDWEELPDDLTAAEMASLQAPMNRHDRRAAIKLMRLQRKAKK